MKKSFLWRWLVLLSIAFGGSIVYGGFVGLSGIFPGENLWKSAVVFTGAAGLSWVIFIPLLVAVTGFQWMVVVEDCLLAMAWGELVLNAGALIQVVLGLYCAGGVYGTILVSNVVMMVYLANRLRRKGYPRCKTMRWWLVVQNGLFVVWVQVIQKWMEV